MLKKKISTLAVVAIVTMCAIGLESCDIPYVSKLTGKSQQTSDSSKKEEKEIQINNTGISFSENKISVAGDYVYVVDKDTLYRYNSSDNYSKEKVLSVDSGSKILSPVVYKDRIYYIVQDSKGKSQLMKYTFEDSDSSKVGDPLLDVTKLYYDTDSIYVTVPESQDANTKYDLVKISIKDEKSTTIEKDVIKDNIFPSNSTVYYEKMEDGKVYLYTLDSSKSKKLSEFVDSPFIVSKGEAYFVDNYSYIKESWSQLKNNNQQESTSSQTSTTSTSSGTTPTQPAQTQKPSGISKIYRVPLTAGATKSEVYTKAPVGLIAGTENNVYFSNLYGGNFRGVIRLSLDERKESLAYKDESKITALYADSADGKVYFTVDDTDGFYVMSATGTDIKQVK